jgi:thioredoxin 1
MNKTEFQQKISAAGKPVIIDFWAPWCAPCRMTKPILEKLAQEYAGRVDFLPLNADDSGEVVGQFRVFGIPTVLALRDGKEAGRVVGAQNEGNYRSMFESLAAGKEVKVLLAPFDRLLRLGAGALFITIGVLTGNWLVAAGGGILAFLGVYDRCPVWAAITGILRRK